MTDSVDLVELGRAIAGASAIAGAVKAVERDGKTAMLDAIGALGVKTFSADVTDGADVALGAVTYRKASSGYSVVVEDEQALLAWAKKNWPEALAEVVDPAWLARVVAYAKKTGTTGCADTGGDVLPGVTVTATSGSPTIAVTLTAEAKQRAAALIAGGLTLALPAAPDPADDAALVEAAALAAVEDEDHR
jgi:hypothetical protein